MTVVAAAGFAAAGLPGLSGCSFTGEPEPAADGSDKPVPEQVAPVSPETRWSGDPIENRTAAQQEAADEAEERDGDELESAGQYEFAGALHPGWPEFDIAAIPGAIPGPGPGPAGPEITNQATGSSCDNPLGSFDYCGADCTCDAEEGDCDSDSDCATGLVCMRDTGDLFGFDPEVDVCMEQCSDDASGTGDFCSPECPCEPGEADCDDDADCAGDGVCAKNVGASFGYEPTVDVCVSACDPILNGDWDYCSSDCQCEDGQGDCDSDSDCAPGHYCAHNVGAEYGYDERMDVCVAIVIPTETFAGRVINARGDAVVSAKVTINQVEIVTGDDGRFGLTVDGTSDKRYVINVEKQGFVPRSHIHIGDGVEDIDLVVSEAEVIAIDPTEDVDVEDQSGTRLVLPPNALVDENGDPPRGPIKAEMHTYDLLEEPMVGDMTAIGEDGETVMLESVGAVSVDFLDASGNRYQLAEGQTAQISIELPEGIEFAGTVPLLSFDMDTGRWIEEGEGIVIDGVAYGEVSHFSVWNFDIKRIDPACVKVIVPDELAAPGASIQGRVVVPPPFPRTRTVDLDNGDNVLINLPPNVDIEIFIPSDAAQPLAVVNTGSAWGGRGVPPEPYSACNGNITLPTDLPGQLIGFALLEGRDAHNTITIVARNAAGDVVATTSPSTVGQYTFPDLPPGTYTIEQIHLGYLSVVVSDVEVLAGKVKYLPCTQLPGGDVDENGVIDANDVDEVLTNQGTSVPAGDARDINGDGVIDDKDLVLVESNEGLEGPVDADNKESDCPSATANKIVGGGYHSCVLQDNGTVRCWGYNGHGQLGYGNTNHIGDNETLLFAGPVDVGAAVSDIFLGRYHTCALLSGGAVRCWGYNGYGQLGYGNTARIGDNETPASAGNVDVGGAVTQIAAGQYHTCALLNSGAVRCWGRNNEGQLGYGNTSDIGDNETPASAGDVNVGGTVTQLAAGDYHTCALLDTGSVRCWGYNYYGQLGYGNTSDIGDNETPASAGDINVGGTVVQIAAGAGHTCARLDTGTVRCWGYNGYGQLGYGNTTRIGDNEAPATAGDVNVGAAVVDIKPGSVHTCALLDGGGVRCWGYNWAGQLGYGNTTRIGDNEPPAAAGDVPVGGAATQITTGWHHTCAALDSGGVRCWGYNYYGSLGYGHTSNIGDNETPASVGDVPFL